jgi:hypothetical protein
MAELLGEVVAREAGEVVAREAGCATGEMINYALKGVAKKQEEDDDNNDDNGKD